MCNMWHRPTCYTPMCEVGCRELGVLQPNTLLQGLHPHSRVLMYIPGAFTGFTCHRYYTSRPYPILYSWTGLKLEGVVVSGTQATGLMCMVWGELGWALASFQLRVTPLRRHPGWTRTLPHNHRAITYARYVFASLCTCTYSYNEHYYKAGYGRATVCTTLSTCCSSSEAAPPPRIEGGAILLPGGWIPPLGWSLPSALVAPRLPARLPVGLLSTLPSSSPTVSVTFR